MTKYFTCLGACLAWCLNSVLNVKALIEAFNQGEGLSSALLHDSKIFAKVCFQLYYSPCALVVLAALAAQQVGLPLGEGHTEHVLRLVHGRGHRAPAALLRVQPHVVHSRAPPQ